MKCYLCEERPLHFRLDHRCDIFIAMEARDCLKQRKLFYGKVDGYVKIDCFNKEDVDNFKSFFTEEELKHIRFTRIF